MLAGFSLHAAFISPARLEQTCYEYGGKQRDFSGGRVTTQRPSRKYKFVFNVGCIYFIFRHTPLNPGPGGPSSQRRADY